MAPRRSGLPPHSRVRAAEGLHGKERRRHAEAGGRAPRDDDARVDDAHRRARLHPQPEQSRRQDDHRRERAQLGRAAAGDDRRPRRRCRCWRSRARAGPTASASTCRAISSRNSPACRSRDFLRTRLFEPLGHEGHRVLRAEGEAVASCAGAHGRGTGAGGRSEPPGSDGRSGRRVRRRRAVLDRVRLRALLRDAAAGRTVQRRPPARAADGGDDADESRQSRIRSRRWRRAPGGAWISRW